MQGFSASEGLVGWTVWKVLMLQSKYMLYKVSLPLILNVKQAHRKQEEFLKGAVTWQQIQEKETDGVSKMQLCASLWKPNVRMDGTYKVGGGNWNWDIELRPSWKDMGLYGNNALKKEITSKKNNLPNKDKE